MQDPMMMRYMSPGPMSREPHSPVREEFQPVYPPPQSGNVRVRPPASPPTQGEEENRACSQFNVDRYMSCETMPSDYHRFGNSGNNKRQGAAPGGDSRYDGYSTLPSALGSYPTSPHHFEAEAEVLPVDYPQDASDEANSRHPGREGEGKTSASKIHGSEGNNNGTMPEFIPPRRGKQSVSFAPQVDIQYPVSDSHTQYPPPTHNMQYPSPSHDRQYASPPHDRQYPPTLYDKQYSPPSQYPPSRDGHYPPSARDGQYSPLGHDKQYPSSGHDKQYPSSGHDKQYPSSGHDKQYPSSGHDKQYPLSGHDKQYPSSGHDKQYLSSGHDEQYPATAHDKQYHPTGHGMQYPPSGQSYPASSSMQYPRPASPSSMQYPRPASPSSMQYPRPASPSSMQYPRPPSPSSMPYPCPASPSSGQYPPPATPGSVQYPPASANAINYPPANSKYPPPANAKYPTPADIYPPPTNEKYPSPADAMYPPPVNEKDQLVTSDTIPTNDAYPPPNEKKGVSLASDRKSPTPDDDTKNNSPTKELKHPTQTADAKLSCTQGDTKSDDKTPTRPASHNPAPRLPSGQPSVAKAQQMYCPLTQYGDTSEDPEDDNSQADEMPEMFPARPTTPSCRSRCVTPNTKPGRPSSQGNTSHPKPPSTPPIGRTCSPGSGKLLTTSTAQETASKDESSSRPASPTNAAKGNESKPSSRPPTPIPDKPLTSSELPIGDLNDPFPPSSDDCIKNIYPNPSQINTPAPNPSPGSPIPQSVTGSSPRPAGPVPASQMMVPPMGNFEVPPEPSPPKGNLHPPGPVPPSQMMMPPMGSFETDMQNQSNPPNYYGNQSPPPTQGGNVEPWSSCYVPQPPWAQQVGQHYRSPNNHRTRSPSPARERGHGASPGPQLDEFGRVMMMPARARSRCSSPNERTDEFGREFMSRSPGPGSCGPESTRMWPSSGKRNTPTPRGHASPRRQSSPSPMRGGSPTPSQNYSSSWGGGNYFEPNSNFPNYPTEYCKNGQTMSNRPGSPRGRKHAGSSGLCDNIYPTPRQAQSPSNCGSPSRPDQQYFYGEGDGGCGEPWRGGASSMCEDEAIPSHWRKSPGPTMGHMSPKEWNRSRSRSRSRGNFHHLAQNHEVWPTDNKSKTASYPTQDADHGDVADSPAKYARNRSRSKSLIRSDGKSAASSPNNDEGLLFSAYPNPQNLTSVQPEANEEPLQSRSLSRCPTPADVLSCQNPSSSFKEKQINPATEINAESQEGSVHRSRWEKFHEHNPHQQQPSDQEEHNVTSDDQFSSKVKIDEVSDEGEKQTSPSNASGCSAPEEYPLAQYPPPKRLSPEQSAQLQDKQEMLQPQQELDHQTHTKQDQDSSRETKKPQEIIECPSGETENDKDSGPTSFDAFPIMPNSSKNVKSEQPQFSGLNVDGKPTQPQNDEEGTETDMEMANYIQNTSNRPNPQSHHPATLQPSSKHPVTSPLPHNTSSPVNFYPPQDTRTYPPGSGWPPDYPYHEPPSSRHPTIPHSSHHSYPQQTYPNTREEAHPYRRGHPPAYQNQHYPPQGWQRGASPTPDQRSWQRGASPPPDQRNWQRGASSPPPDQRNWQRCASPPPDQRSWQSNPSPTQDPRYWPRGASSASDQRRWPRSGSPIEQRVWPHRGASPTRQRNWSQRGASPIPDQRGGWPQRGASPSADYHHGQPHHNQQMMEQPPQRTKRGFPPNAGYGPHPCSAEDSPMSNGHPKYNEQPYPEMPPSIPQKMPPTPTDEEMHQHQSVHHQTSGKLLPPQTPDYWTGSVPEADESKIPQPGELQETDHLNAGSQHAQNILPRCPENGPPHQGMQIQTSAPEPLESPQRYNSAPPASPRRYQDAAPPGSPKRPQEPVSSESPNKYPSKNNKPEDDQENPGRLTEEGQYREASSYNLQTTPPDQQLPLDANQLPVQRQIFQSQQQIPGQQQPPSAQSAYCQQQQSSNALQQSHQQQSHQQQTYQQQTHQQLVQQQQAHQQQGYQQQKRSQMSMQQNEPHAQQQEGLSQIPPPMQQQSQMQSPPQMQQPHQSAQVQQESVVQQKPPSPAPQSTPQSYPQQQWPQSQPDQCSNTAEKQQTHVAQQSQQYSQNQLSQPVPSSTPSTPIKQHCEGQMPKSYPPTPPSPMADSRRQQKGADLEQKQSPRDQENKQLFEDTSQPIASPRQMPSQLPNISPRKTPPHSVVLSPRKLQPQPAPSPRKLPSTPVSASPRKILSTIEENQPDQSDAPMPDGMERCDEPQFNEEQLQIQELQENGSVPSTPKSHKSDSSRGNESNRGNDTSRTNESNRTNDSNQTAESTHEREDVSSVNPCPPQERDFRSEVNRRIANWMNSTNVRMDEASERLEMPVRPLTKETNPAPSPLKKQGYPLYPSSERVGSMGDGNNVNVSSGRSHALTNNAGNVRSNEAGGERNTILKEMVRRTSSNMGKEVEDNKKLDKLTEALAEAERIMNTCRAKDNAVKETLGLKPSDTTRTTASDFTRIMPKTNAAVADPPRPTVNTQSRQQSLSNVSQSGSSAWRSSAATRVGDSTTPSSQNRWTPRDILNAELERRTSGAQRSSGSDGRDNVRGTQSSSELRDIISNLSSRAKARAAPTMTQVTDLRNSSASSPMRQESAMSMTSLRSKVANQMGGMADTADAKRRSSTQDVRRPEVRGDPKTGNLDDEKFASMRDKFMTFFNNYQKNPGSGGGRGSTRH